MSDFENDQVNETQPETQPEANDFFEGEGADAWETTEEQAPQESTENAAAEDAIWGQDADEQAANADANVNASQESSEPAPQEEDAFESGFPDSDFNNEAEPEPQGHEEVEQRESSDSAYGSPPTDSADNALNPIAESRMKRMQQLEDQRALSLQKRNEQREHAQTFKTQWYADRKRRLETKSQLNREQESLFFESRGEEQGSTWENVAKHIDVSNNAPAQAKDTTRLKKLIIALKSS